MEEHLIIEVWDTFKDYIPEKSRDTAASQFIDFLVGQDVEIETLESVLGYDPHLDTAITFSLNELKDPEDDEEDLDFEDEEEDY
jgi:hypothetical protein